MTRMNLRHEKGRKVCHTSISNMKQEIQSGKRRSARLRSLYTTKGIVCTESDDSDDKDNIKQLNSSISSKVTKRISRKKKNTLSQSKKRKLEFSLTTKQKEMNWNNNEMHNLDEKKTADPCMKTCNPLLLDISPLVQGKVIRRPSEKVKSPYVADVLILPDGPIVQAHAPALDVGGLCSPGSIVSLSIRPPGGKTSHSIELVSSINETSETQNDIDDVSVFIGAHPRLGEVLAERILSLGLLEDKIGYGPALEIKNKKSSKQKIKFKEDIDNNVMINGNEINQTYLRKQCQYGDSRVDFELTRYTSKYETNKTIQTPNDSLNTNSLEVMDKSMALIEVKNVVCADYSENNAPEKRGPNHCVIIAQSEKDNMNDVYQRSAIFPWGRKNQSFEGKKVVSERAIKHIRNLVQIANTNEKKSKGIHTNESKKSIKPIILFVVNRSDCEFMRACHEIDPTFAKELKKASDSGVQIVAVRIKWNENGQAFYDGVLDVKL